MFFKRKVFWYSIGIIFVLIQFYPVDRPIVNENNQNDLFINIEGSNEVKQMFRTSCYDCHSNETNYPWYASIAPMKWMLYEDIEEGRSELNFSEWQELSKADMVEKLDDIYTVMEENEMPLKGYTMLHSNARLSENDRELIMQWTEDFMEKLYD